MERLFVFALFGHLIGDYLLQSKWMALTKSVAGRDGVNACTVHVAIYTVAVCAMVGTLSPVFAAAVFVPHWIIDRWSLASHWLRLIRGRTFEDALANTTQYREFDIAFTAIVYTVTDNTMHILCLWPALYLVVEG
jgi:Protein of unknown function (DUF3307)